MKKKFSVIFLGRKMSALHALEYLQQKKIIIRMIVCPSEGSDGSALRSFARRYKIPFYVDDTALYTMISKNDTRIRDTDLVISYLYPRKIREPLIQLGKRGCINLHPAPLPEYKGRAGYNTAILEGKMRFGVSAHFIDSEHFDVGPIIRVLRFPIDSKHETVFSLEKRSQEKLLELFKSTIDLFVRSHTIRTLSNKGGLYLTGKQLEAMKRIGPNDSLEEIRRKIRAFTFPPYHGASIKLKGETFTIVDSEMLQEIARLIS